MSLVRSRRAPGLIALSVLLIASGCNDSESVVSPGGKFVLGTWGGDNAGVIVTDSVTHAHIGCTFGDVPGVITLDANGRFAVDGSYVLRAYPIQVGPSLPAQFSGEVVGKRLTFAVAVNDTTQGTVVSLGPVTVTFGDEPRMGPCPICTVNTMRSSLRSRTEPRP